MIIQRIQDSAPLRTLMNQDAGETAYALGDLDAAMWSLTEFWGAFANAELQGFILFFYGFEIPTLTMHGTCIPDVLAELDLPLEAFCLAPERYQEAVAGYYDVSHLYSLHRMVVNPQTFQPETASLQPGWSLRRLRAADAGGLNALYAQASDPGEAIMAFSPSQIELGVFYGVEQAGALLAAAGTHVVSVQENIGAVGNVFTVPAMRGHGLGGITTAAVTRGLFEMGVTRVVLNVKQKNKPAIRVYEKLGYRVHMPFIEGPITRRS